MIGLVDPKCCIAGQIPGDESVPDAWGMPGGEIDLPPHLCHTVQEKAEGTATAFSAARINLFPSIPASSSAHSFHRTHHLSKSRHHDQVSRSFHLGRGRPGCRVQGCVAYSWEKVTTHPLVPARAIAGPSSAMARTFATAPLRQSRAPRSAMIVPQLLSTRSYAAEAGGRFNRSKPHFK
jgi:hypothetical protein